MKWRIHPAEPGAVGLVAVAAVFGIELFALVVVVSELIFILCLLTA
jgi:hypothetical protein